MMLREHFLKMCERIRAMGYDDATAGNYAALIGDRPIIDGEHVIVMDQGKELARLDRKALGFDARPPGLPGGPTGGR